MVLEKARGNMDRVGWMVGAKLCRLKNGRMAVASAGGYRLKDG